MSDGKPNNHRAENWWKSAVIYQIYPRSYQDSNQDGIGDIPGIIQRLPYLSRLGVDTLWLSPVFCSPMKDFGYDVSDYRDIDPLFGSLDDFDELITQAHALQLRVMVDQVLSHSSDQHPWFVESRRDRSNDKADWYVWADAADDGGPPSNWLSVFGGSAWQWDTRRKQYYLHNFLAEQPDLNFHHPEVQAAMLDVMRFWLERGVDGFRLDTVNFYFHDQALRDNPPHHEVVILPAEKRPGNTYGYQYHLYDKSRPENLAFLQRMRALCDEYQAALLGEIGCDDQVKRMVEYTSEGRLHTAYSFALLGPDYHAGFIHKTLKPFLEAPDAWPTWSIGNHDVQRLASRWTEGGAATTQTLQCFAVLQMTLPGTPCIYQGEELGLPEQSLAFEELVDPPGITFWPDYVGRDGCRTPMPWEKSHVYAGFSQAEPWLPIREPHLSLSADQQENDPDSLLNFYRDLLKWRRRQPALLGGEAYLLSVKNPAVLEYQRYSAEQTLTIRLNLSADTQTVEVLAGTCLLGENTGELGAYAYCVVSA